MLPPSQLELPTRLAHLSRALDPPANLPMAPALYQSVAYRFRDLEHVDDFHAGTTRDFLYYRYGTPNARLLERAVADAEAAEAAVATGSGMAAIAAVLLALLANGDHVVADRHIYGGTFALLTTDLPRLGIETTFVDLEEANGLAAAARSSTRILLLETLTNPTLRVTDLPRLATAAHERGWLVCVDNTFTTPCLIQPRLHGADLVWQATSKYIGGQGQALGGVVAGGQDLVDSIRAAVSRLGLGSAPFDAWLAAQGLATLALRMERACQNAQHVADFLAHHPAVAVVHYPGLASHPHHDLARRLYRRGYGGMLACELKGGDAAVRALLRRLRLIGFVPTLADVTTTVSVPAATSHRDLPPPVLAAMGVGPGLVRLSCGIEAADDIVADLAQALDGVC
jgi:cystathionine beta-lyase/cystathionine gamma-synthase